jgi:hypothetical protein
MVPVIRARPDRRQTRCRDLPGARGLRADRAIGEADEPPRRPRLLDRAPRDSPTLARIPDDKITKVDSPLPWRWNG